ncbi:MerR family transcriptional regulator [Bacillus sonorensis]|uniref:Transcriptional regulator n=2 Tax=Bacillus sonorensis TaxID=119858 RepID=M5PBS5_9BACI|nr:MULTISPECIES: MerR family transcriptional regulator [Bacillus]TWK79514.1 Multidrug-efflux transporter 1 regulator [Bacillus paralicheniformis]ASB87284.1 Multidrug-efflux transporter 1 regulator [Bacillus sonorensis]EME73235.1 transcriptional regulator [Bacillus sonorensis L12]MBG9914230.1 transcriptional regulator [Bacillus sonorensis]MCY8403105.1 MerR family transcriptional regulator [Bacillus sonorensis]
MFKISEFSNLSQVSVKALRYYDQIGLLKPAHIDAETGYRYYTANQLFPLNRILAFKELGFTLQQIIELMEENVSGEQIRGMFRLKKAEIETLLAEEGARLQKIEERLEQVEKEDCFEPENDIVLKKIESRQLLSVRRKTSIQQIPALFGELDARFGKSLTASLPKMVLWHGCEECEDEVDLEAGYLVQRPFPPEGSDAVVRRLPEVPMMATLLHRCRPTSPCTASAHLGLWLEQKGYRMKENEPRREVFLHPEHNHSSDYIAEIQIPIEKVHETLSGIKKGGQT